MYILADSNLCTSETGYRLFGLLGHIINFIQIIIPILLIVIGIIELVKTLINPDLTNSKGIKNLLIKLLLGALVFFVPFTVKFILKNANVDTKNACIDCLTDPNSCIKKADELSPLKCSENESFKNDKNCTDKTCKDRKDCKKLKGEWKCCIADI